MSKLAREIRSVFRLEREKGVAGHNRQSRDEVYLSFCVRNNDREVARLGGELLRFVRGGLPNIPGMTPPFGTKVLTQILADYRSWYDEYDIPFPEISIQMSREHLSSPIKRSRLKQRFDKVEALATGYIRYCSETQNANPSNLDLSLYSDLSEVAVSRLSKERIYWAVLLTLLDQRLVRGKNSPQKKALWEEVRTIVGARIPLASMVGRTQRKSAMASGSSGPSSICPSLIR